MGEAFRDEDLKTLVMGGEQLYGRVERLVGACGA